MTTNRMKALFDESGAPRWVAIYDNGGESADRYTVYFTAPDNNDESGAYKILRDGYLCHARYTFTLSMSGSPFWPQGVCLHGEVPGLPYSFHDLGEIDDDETVIGFWDLPEDCRIATLGDYAYYWDIVDDPDSGVCHDWARDWLATHA